MGAKIAQSQKGENTELKIKRHLHTGKSKLPNSKAPFRYMTNTRKSVQVI